MTLLVKPAIREKVLTSLVDYLNEAAKQTIRDEECAKSLLLATAGQDYFEQPSMRLHFIVDQLVQTTIDMYKGLKRMAAELSALGLQLMGFGIPIGLCGPFVKACARAVRPLTDDDAAKDAFRDLRADMMEELSRKVASTVSPSSGRDAAKPRTLQFIVNQFVQNSMQLNSMVNQFVQIMTRLPFIVNQFVQMSRLRFIVNQFVKMTTKFRFHCRPARADYDGHVQRAQAHGR